MNLGEEGHTLSVSQLGATVTRWQFGERHILFPQQMVRVGDELKLRGGVPISFPNFGPPPEGSNLPQHGFMRDTTMNRMELLGGVGGMHFSRELVGEFPGAFPWEFSLAAYFGATSHGFSHTICVARKGTPTARQPMPLGVGIHPYFRTPQGVSLVKISDDDIPVTGETFDPGYPLVLLANPPISVDLAGMGRVNLDLKGLYATDQARIVIWTDDPRYVCVEPVIADPKNFGKDNGFYLREDEWVYGDCTFEFEPL